MAKVELKRSTDENSRVVIASYGIDPIVAHLSEEAGTCTVMYLADYSEELAVSNAIVKQDAQFSYQYLLDLTENVWGELADGCSRNFEETQ